MLMNMALAIWREWNRWEEYDYKKPLQEWYYSSLNEDSSRTTLTHAQRMLDLSVSIHNCGKGLKFKCHNTECNEQTGLPTERILRQYCAIRICRNAGCRKKRENKIKDKYEAKLNSFKDPRFLTLTLKDYHPLSRKPIDRLNYAWKRMSTLLRRSGYVKSYIKVIEMNQWEYVDSNLEYHYVYFWHIHVVYDGVYINADLLRSAWEQYTKDSFWINISRVKTNFSAGAYLRKYLQKLSYDDLDIEEYYKVYKMKLISSYNCDEEVETLLEYSILVIGFDIKCKNCGRMMYPIKEG